MLKASTIASILGIILLILVVVILISCVKIVHQAQALVIERLGAYQATWGVGIHFKIPIIERVARRIDLKEQVVDFEPQAVITKDNVTRVIRSCSIRSRTRSCSATAWQIRSWRLRT